MKDNTKSKRPTLANGPMHYETGETGKQHSLSNPILKQHRRKVKRDLALIPYRSVFTFLLDEVLNAQAVIDAEPDEFNNEYGDGCRCAVNQARGALLKFIEKFDTSGGA